jgi:hypothetical protein
MYGTCLLKKYILWFKWPIDGIHTFDTNRLHINITIVLFHASFIYLWYGCNNVIYNSYDTYNTCVPYNTYGPYCQMGTNCTYGACGTCGTFGAYGLCGTYVTHVLYLQMVHISMDLLNEYKHVFTSLPKNKIRSTLIF